MYKHAMIIRCGGVLIAVCMLATTVVGEAPPPATADTDDRLEKSSTKLAPTPSAKLLRYAKRVIGRYDKNGDAMLQATEWKSMAGKPARIDVNQDGVITADEFAAHVATYGHFRRMLLLSPNPSDNSNVRGTALGENGAQPNRDNLESLRRNKKFYVPNSRLPKGLSQDFFNRDRDGDGQLTQAEFAPKLTAAELERFKKLDANLDGVITAREYARGPKADTPQTDKTPTASGQQP